MINSLPFFIYMVTITDFKITDNGDNLQLNFENNTTSRVVSVLLWDMNSFKDYSKAYNISYKLEDTPSEQIIVSKDELQITGFSDMWFVEIIMNPVEDSEFLTPALGITYNLNPYKLCILDKFFKKHDTVKPCKSCDDIVDDSIVAMSLIMDIFEDAIDQGYYIQAIELLNKLQKLCSFKECSNCKTIECKTCSKFKQN